MSIHMWSFPPWAAWLTSKGGEPSGWPILAWTPEGSTCQPAGRGEPTSRGKAVAACGWCHLFRRHEDPWRHRLGITGRAVRCQDRRTRDHIEATQPLIVHRLQHLAHESGRRPDELTCREPGEPITPADRR
jgi:hypothetical protein